MCTLRPRWTALLILPLLAGALLLMHGLDAGAARHGLHGEVAATHPEHADAPPVPHEAGCEGCVADHAVAACVAIVAAVVGLRLARRSVARRVFALIASASCLQRAGTRLPGSRGPAWIHLSVMRC